MFKKEAVEELKKEFSITTPKQLLKLVINFLIGFIPLFLIGYTIGHINTAANYCTYQDTTLGSSMINQHPNILQNQTYTYYLNNYNKIGGIPLGTHLSCKQDIGRWIKEPKNWSEVLKW